MELPAGSQQSRDSVTVGGEPARRWIICGAGLVGMVASLSLVLLSVWPQRASSGGLFVPMAPKTALCFVLLAVALAVFNRWEPPRRLSLCRVAAILVAAIALARLIEYATGLDLAVDRWLLPAPAEKLDLAPAGKMALFSTLSFASLSVSLLLLSRATRPRLAARLAATLAVGVGFIGLTFTLGYFFVQPGQLAESSVVPMALPTALCFLVLGTVTAWSALLGEVAERRHVRAQLRRERNLFATVMETSPTAIVLVDPMGRLTFANATAERTLGLDRREILSRTYNAAAWRLTDFAGQPVSSENLTFSRVKASGKPVFGTQLAIERADGQRVFVLVNGAPLRNEQGEFDGMVATLEDVSEHLRAEAELRRAKERAEQADQTKSAFLASMSHELRTPLNGIIGFSELLVDQRFGPLNKTQAEYVETVLTSARHLLGVINDVLDLSKVASGRMELALEHVAVAPVAANATAALKALAQAKRIEVRLAMREALPAVLADEGRLKQIFYNLLSNAIKFTPEGGAVTIRAETVAAPNGAPADQLEVSVTDTGIGIQQEDQERVFREFEQVRPESPRSHQGTGLGLALTRRFVELHGGRLWVESAGKGKGTTFRFTLPLAES